MKRSCGWLFNWNTDDADVTGLNGFMNVPPLAKPSVQLTNHYLPITVHYSPLKSRTGIRVSKPGTFAVAVYRGVEHIKLFIGKVVQNGRFYI